jgi:hypothetical protein
MATITDPAINDWWNAECRTLSEDFEALEIRMKSANDRYVNEITALLAAPAGTDLLDLRVAEGIPISSKDQMITWVSNLQAMIAALDVAGRKDVLVYPAVRKPV